MSQLTKKFFSRMAASVSLITDSEERGCLAENIGQQLADTNKKFNWDAWLDACNVKTEKGLASHVPADLKTVVPFPASPPPKFYADPKAEFERDYAN